MVLSSKTPQYCCTCEGKTDDVLYQLQALAVIRCGAADVQVTVFDNHLKEIFPALKPRLRSGLSEADRRELCDALDSVMLGRAVTADLQHPEAGAGASFVKLLRLSVPDGAALNDTFVGRLDRGAAPRTPAAEEGASSRRFCVTPGPPTPLTPIEQPSLCFTPEHRPRKPNFSDLSPDLFD